MARLVALPLNGEALGIHQPTDSRVRTALYNSINGFTGVLVATKPFSLRHQNES